MNHAAVAVDDRQEMRDLEEIFIVSFFRIFSFGGYCTGDNYKDEKPIDVFVLNTSTCR